MLPTADAIEFLQRRNMQRSVARLAPKIKGDIPPNMVKWWKSYTPFHGQVTRTVTPFNVNVVGSLFHNAPSKLK